MDLINFKTLFCLILIASSASQNVPQTSGYQSQLLDNMMNDLRKVYGPKPNNMQMNFNKRNTELQTHYHELLDILKGEHRMLFYTI